VGAFAPFTTTALARPGSRAIATSAEFPGAIPDHLVVAADLAQNRPEAVQALVDTWFDTLEWMKNNRDAAVSIMAKRGGVSVEEYQAYESGTTLFTRRQNLDAFRSGTTPAHLNHQAGRVAEFLNEAQLMQGYPNLDGLFDSRFVEAVPE
jgi:NitT/TauT family transport system substrate-binding protein